MDPYDSDSSVFEDGDYTETGVVLGFASEEAVDDSISHLGGWPTWLDPSNPPPGNFAKCKVCNQPMPLLLQLHGDLPQYPHDERWLYIFGCTKRGCSRKTGSIRALRSVKKHKIGGLQKAGGKKEEIEEKEQQQQQAQRPKQDLGASLFGVSPSMSSPSGNANPFSMSSSASASSTPASQANPFAPLPQPSTLAAIPPQKPEAEEKLSESFADKVRISSPPPPPFTSTSAEHAKQPIGPPLPWPDQSAFPKPYPHYYLDAENETLSRPPTPALPTSVPAIDEEPASSAGGAADSKDAFESSLDKAFLRFSTRLGHNPEQVLRYEYGGTPLLYSTSDAVGRIFASSNSNGSGSGSSSSHIKTTGRGGAAGGNRIPRCESCGRERVFELQLVPHAISVLEEGREGIGFGPNDDAGMEWGTVILGVCAGNCGSDQEGVVAWREEWVGVQWEERAPGH
ncbi:hypothetical protein VTO42DRAFT_953 [Malbranchea cinnamomea]